MTTIRVTTMLTKADVQEIVRNRIAQAGSLRALAVQWKCSVQYLSDVARGRRNPGPLILEALRLELVYQPKPEPKYRRR